MTEDLSRRQEEMKLRVSKRREKIQKERELRAQERANPANRPVCISCRRRYARVGSAYCSRCTSSGMIQNLRDKLPGQVTEAPTPAPVPLLPTPIEIGVSITESEPSPKEPIPQKPIPVDRDYYTRTQVGEMLDISATTILRWERKGKTPSPLRVAHNNQCMYTPEIVEAIREYKSRTYVPPVQAVTPGTPESITRVVKKSVKVNKRLERAVAVRLGSLGRRGL